jgi:hypothetical protein
MMLPRTSVVLTMAAGPAQTSGVPSHQGYMQVFLVFVFFRDQPAHQCRQVFRLSCASPGWSSTVHQTHGSGTQGFNGSGTVDNSSRSGVAFV